MLRKPTSILHDVWLLSRTQSVAINLPRPRRRDVLITSRDAFTMLVLHASARAFTTSFRYTARRLVTGPSRQGARRLRRRRRADPGRHRSHLGVRLRARIGHSRQGPRAQPALGVLVRAHRPHRSESFDLDRTSADYPAGARRFAAPLEGRSMLCARTTPLPVECVARGYLSGSGWKDYKATGELCGIPLPKGLRESDRLPEPIFTPATKAESGHDENISEAAAAKVVGADLLARLKRLTLELYAHGVAHAESQGHHPRRHEVRVRDHRRRRAAADRRSDDAGFVALLAEGQLLARRPAAELRQAVRARLSRVDQVEQAAAGAVAARRRGRATPAPSISTRIAASPDGNWKSPLHKLLDQLVVEMVDRGVHYEDAQREFDKRFIACVIQKATATCARPPTRSASTATRWLARSRN